MSYTSKRGGLREGLEDALRHVDPAFIGALEGSGEFISDPHAFARKTLHKPATLHRRTHIDKASKKILGANIHTALNTLKSLQDKHGGLDPHHGGLDIKTSAPYILLGILLIAIITAGGAAMYDQRRKHLDNDAVHRFIALQEQLSTPEGREKLAKREIPYCTRRITDILNGKSEEEYNAKYVQTITDYYNEMHNLEPSKNWLDYLAHALDNHRLQRARGIEDYGEGEGLALKRKLDYLSYDQLIMGIALRRLEAAREKTMMEKPQ